MDEDKEELFFYEREIWFCYIGPIVGREQNGRGEEMRRPVLIIRKFNQDLFFGIPLTTVMKQGSFFRNVGLVDGKHATAILCQARTFSSERLLKKIDTLDDLLFLEMKRAARYCIFGG